MKYTIIPIMVLFLIGTVFAMTSPADIVDPNEEPREQPVTEEVTKGSSYHNDCNFDDEYSRCELRKWDVKYMVRINHIDYQILYNSKWEIPRFYVGNRMVYLENGYGTFNVGERIFEFNEGYRITIEEVK